MVITIDTEGQYVSDIHIKINGNTLVKTPSDNKTELTSVIKDDPTNSQNATILLSADGVSMEKTPSEGGIARASLDMPDISEREPLIVDTMNESF